MKLIDILVDELPKRGGWPGAIPVLVQNSSGYVYQAGGGEYIYRLKLADDWMLAEIKREQYESALAASKTEWDGEGLPSVGIKCEHCPGGTTQHEWEVVTIAGIYENLVTGFTDFWLVKENGSSYTVGNPYRFRPIRSEAGKKRSDICDKIYGAMTTAEREGNRSDMAEAVYDAIAAGKIPGIRID
ncbi:hypothetical protein [Huaxiibacter chinensis]